MSTPPARKTLWCQLSSEKRDPDGDGVLIKRFWLKNFRNVMYAAQRRAWTTDHTSCNGTQVGPCLSSSFCLCAASDRGAFSAINYVSAMEENLSFTAKFRRMEMEKMSLNSVRWVCPALTCLWSIIWWKRKQKWEDKKTSEGLPSVLACLKPFFQITCASMSKHAMLPRTVEQIWTFFAVVCFHLRSDCLKAPTWLCLSNTEWVCKWTC